MPLRDHFASEGLTYRDGELILVAPALVFGGVPRLGGKRHPADEQLQGGLLERLLTGGSVADAELVAAGLLPCRGLDAADELSDIYVRALGWRGVGCHLRQRAPGIYTYELWRD
jgi:hypothetical protein